jgi:hypothetical protein
MPDYKEYTDKFLPWEDEEGRKIKPNRGDSIPPKTNIRSRVHSKPKTDGQEYLDMYIGTKEKERTEKYGEILAKRQKGVAETWRDIKKQLALKQTELLKPPQGGVEESEELTHTKTEKPKKVPAHMAKLDWNY